MTIDEFIKSQGLTAQVLPAHRNPHMSDMPRNWSVEIRKWREGQQPLTLVTPFSQGSALKAPTLADVLDCLASDAASVRNARDFEDWASDFGYDADSRKALATFNACLSQAADLEALLGAAPFQTLLFGIDRL